jgi:hypothetical protein
VIVRYRLQLPRRLPAIIPEKIFCQDANCLARICDMGLPYMLVNKESDIEIACHRCRQLTHLKINGVLTVS